MSKKVLFLVLAVVIILGLISTGGYLLLRKKTERVPPDKIKIKLPTGEAVDAYRIRFSTPNPDVPERTTFVLKGVVKWEEQQISKDVPPMKVVILETETAEKYVLSNPPYVNTLIFNAIGKKVKLSVVSVGKTSFKDYQGVWVEDILEVEK